MRSPGTAPPLARSAPAYRDRCRASAGPPAASDSPGTLNTRLATLGRPNQPLSFGGTAGPALRSSLKSGCTARTTSAENISPRPTPMNTSSSELRARRGNAAFSLSSANFLPARSNARSTICRPRPPYCALTASRVARRMAARARPVTTTIPRPRAARGPRRARSHFVAVVQLGNQRRDAAVDFRADRRIADIGMHGIGEIDRRRAARQRDQPALRGEAKNLILKQFELGVLEKLFGIVARQRLDRLPQAAIGAAFADRRRIGARAGVLVDGVRGDAVFGHLVHLVGANLQFDALAARPDDRRVDRAIVVLLRRRNIVLEAPGHARPGRVRDADRGIAVRDRVDDDAKAIDVGQLLEGDRSALHLAPDRIGLLLPALDLDLDAAPGELIGELGLDAGDDRAVLGLQLLSRETISA